MIIGIFIMFISFPEIINVNKQLPLPPTLRSKNQNLRAPRFPGLAGLYLLRGVCIHHHLAAALDGAADTGARAGRTLQSVFRGDVGKKRENPSIRP